MYKIDLNVPFQLPGSEEVDPSAKTLGKIISQTIGIQGTPDMAKQPASLLKLTGWFKQLNQKQVLTLDLDDLEKFTELLKVLPITMFVYMQTMEIIEAAKKVTEV